jgi:hypothetical protein
MKSGSAPTTSASARFCTSAAKGRFDLATGGGIENFDVPPDDGCCRFRVLDQHLGGNRIGRIDKERDTLGARHQFMQQAQPLGAQLRRHVVDAGNIAARAAEAWHDTGLHRVSAGGKYDRNGVGRCLRGKGSCRANRCDDDRHQTLHQIGRQVREPAVVAVRPAEFDRDIAALGKAGFSKALSERREKTGVRLGKARMEKSDDLRRGLLRARRDWPRGCRAAQQRDEPPSS